ncbi:MAG TPA: amino acid adenylation domain-containing protein [Verrucomicrobiae bacterium]|nr:amino acid adenylation domain-containing protein [Verrucomicrobiae bacterium]
MIAEDEIITRRPELSDEKRALLEKRLRGALKDRSRTPAIPRRTSSGKAPLSFAQQRLWFFDQLEPGSPLYNMPTALRLRGRLNLTALQKALNAMVARHESLRTRFNAEDGCPVQIIVPPAPVELPVLDLSREPSFEREETLRQRLNDEAKRPFDLSRGGLIRALLVRLDETEHVFLVNMHHIISDAWSLGVFFRELSGYYEAFNEGREMTLPGMPIQYADYAAWQHERLQGEALEKQLAFWKGHLAGAPQLLELPAEKTRPPTSSFRGGHVERLLSGSLAEELKCLGQAEGVTLFMTLLSALNVLLHRYTRQTQFIVGSPIAGRTQLETEGLIGFFVNTLALRGDLSGNPTFCELLARGRQTVFDAYAHQDLPFEKLVEALQPARSPGHTPLVQVMFVLQNEMARDLKLPGLTAEPVAVDTGTAKFDLTLAAEEWPDGLLVQAEYNADLFSEAAMARMLGHFQVLLDGIVANPSQKIGELPLLPETERRQLLVEWNGVRTHYPRDKTISQLFEEQVEKTPGAVALVFGGGHLTYRQLNERANALALYLRKLGVGEGTMVAVGLERSADLIVALLGILKAGGAYVSLDPLYPKARLALMLEGTRAPVLLTQEKFRGQFDFALRPPTSDIRPPILVCLDTYREALALPDPANPANRAAPDTPAYVSFTSGSTGRPKGVIVPHRGVVRLVKETNYARFSADETFLQLAPVAFDASTLEIWGALLNGSRLIVFPPHTPSLAELGEFIRQNQISTLWLSAGLFHQMVEEQLENLRGVRQLLAGGDVLSPSHVRRALEKLPGCKMINGYGPTENTTFTCSHEISAADCEGHSIPIGRPIPNTQVYVLDDYLQPVPVGVPGELCAGGDGLSLGYLHQPELTAEKFLHNPFNPDSSRRLYKTGDLVCWRSDGTIEFLGRMDQQVKIRGFRVELDEIETVLNEHPAVRECAVVAWGDRASDRTLAAYFVADSTVPSPAALRAHLSRKLPGYMIPSAFVPMQNLPLNGNGKVNRRALPPPDGQWTQSTKQFLAPRDEVEARLVVIWEEILGISRIGVEDHFFDLGGHSLLAVRLVARIENVFDRKIPVAAVFESPTVAQMAQALRGEKRSATVSSIVEIQPRGTKPPLFFVHGVGGGMFWGYTNLSRYLGADQPVFAFNSRGMNGQEELATVEEMASHYVAGLRAFRPHGPYYLGGYCFGGNVAYEMARQLEAQGEKIALLALINCAPPNSSYARFKLTPVSVFKFLRNLVHWLNYIRHMTDSQRRDFFRWKIRAFKKRWRRLRHRMRITTATVDVDEVVDLSAQPEDRRRLWEAHVRALLAHHTRPYAGRVTLFRTRAHSLFCSFDHTFGWRDYAGTVTVRIVSGAHESVLDEPHVRTLAEALKQCLDQIQTGQTGGNPK